MAIPVSSSASRMTQSSGGSPSSMPAQASTVASAPSLKIGAGAKLLDQRDDPARVVEQHRRGLPVAIDLVRQRARRAVVLDTSMSVRVRSNRPLDEDLLSGSRARIWPSPTPSSGTVRAGSARRANGPDRAAGRATSPGPSPRRPRRRGGFRSGRRRLRPVACRPPEPRS